MSVEFGLTEKLQYLQNGVAFPQKQTAGSHSDLI